MLGRANTRVKPGYFQEVGRSSSGFWVLGNTQFQDTWTYTNGYTDGAKMFSDLVTANRTDYSYEVSEGLKAFGE